MVLGPPIYFIKTNVTHGIRVNLHMFDITMGLQNHRNIRDLDGNIKKEDEP